RVRKAVERNLCDLPIAKAAVAAGQLNDVGGQPLLIVWPSRNMPLGGSSSPIAFQNPSAPSATGIPDAPAGRRRRPRRRRVDVALPDRSRSLHRLWTSIQTSFSRAMVVDHKPRASLPSKPANADAKSPVDTPFR